MKNTDLIGNLHAVAVVKGNILHKTGKHVKAKLNAKGDTEITYRVIRGPMWKRDDEIGSRSLAEQEIRADMRANFQVEAESIGWIEISNS
jgi:hypothetical protein